MLTMMQMQVVKIKMPVAKMKMQVAKMKIKIMLAVKIKMLMMVRSPTRERKKLGKTNYKKGLQNM